MPNARHCIEERKRLATEITNLTTVAAATGDVQALADALRERDRRLKAIDAKLAKPVVVPKRTGVSSLPAQISIVSGPRRYRGCWIDVNNGSFSQVAARLRKDVASLP